MSLKIGQVTTLICKIKTTKLFRSNIMPCCVVAKGNMHNSHLLWSCDNGAVQYKGDRGGVLAETLEKLIRFLKQIKKWHTHFYFFIYNSLISTSIVRTKIGVVLVSILWYLDIDTHIACVFATLAKAILCVLSIDLVHSSLISLFSSAICPFLPLGSMTHDTPKGLFEASSCLALHHLKTCVAGYDTNLLWQKCWYFILILLIFKGLEHVKKPPTETILNMSSHFHVHIL